MTTRWERHHIVRDPNATTSSVCHFLSPRQYPRTMSVSVGVRSQDAAEIPRRVIRHPIFVPSLVGILGFLISVAGITGPSLWYDEAATVTSATRTWSQLFLEIGNVDAVHAAYYALMHVVFDLVGYSPLSLRLPSAIAVGIAAALTVLLGRAVDRPRLALIAGVVFCVLPRTTWMGTEGRSYAMTATLAVAMTLVFVHATRAATARATTARLWIGYVALVVFSCVVFIYLALIVVAHAVSVLWWLRSRGGKFAAPIWQWMIAAGASALLISPFAVIVIGQGHQLYWIKPTGWFTVVRVLGEQWFEASVPFAVVGWIGIVAGAIVLVSRSHGLSAASILLPALAVPTIVLVVVSAFTMPIYAPRYLSMCAPFVAIVVAAAIDALRWKPACVGAVALTVALAIPPAVAQRQLQTKDGATWSQVASFITAQRAASGATSTAAIVYGTLERHPTTTAEVIAVGYPAAFTGTVDVTLDKTGAELGELWDSRLPLHNSLDKLGTADVVYLVTGTPQGPHPTTTESLQSAGWHETATWLFHWITVIRYDRN